MKVLQVMNRTIRMVDGVRIARYLAKISINEVEGYLRAIKNWHPRAITQLSNSTVTFQERQKTN